VSQQEKDLTADKIKLIYEFNNGSPLFARVAAFEIEKGNFLEAIKILENGIDHYPYYPTPFFLISLAYAYAGREEEARSSAAQASELLDIPAVLTAYYKKIDDIIAERNSLTDARRPVFLNDKLQITFDDESEKLEDKLDILAEKLSKAKIIPKNIGEPFDDDMLKERPAKKIVSETMADIYYSQKNYEEAIAIYEELIQLKPEKAELYLQRISDIRSSMDAI
jgi:tetratricopeptide (TPR) repeat protein